MKKIIIAVGIIIMLSLGYWLVSPFFINIQVSESLPSEIMQNVEGAKTPMSVESLVTMTGTFVGFDKIHNGTGTASIYSISNSDRNKRFLRFEEGFQVNNGPDLYVGFGKNGQYVKGSEISKLKGNIGSQNYEIPTTFDLSQYDSVWVWCKAFSTPFIRADLKPVASDVVDTDISSKDSKSITYKNSTADMIQVELPFPDAVVGKEFSVIGKARGNWFFEGSFPIEVLDKNGKVLAIGLASPIGGADWMTTQFVNFKADIKIPQSYIGAATLVLKKDNPSGLVKYDASISFPITIEY